MDRRVTYFLGAVMLIYGLTVARTRLFPEQSGAPIEDSPSTLTAQELPSDRGELEEGIYIERRPYGTRTKINVLSLYIVHPRGSIPEADSRRVYACAENRKGWDLDPVKSETGTQGYPADCARVEKLTPITNNRGETLGIYRASFKEWNSRSYASDELNLNLVRRDVSYYPPNASYSQLRHIRLITQRRPNS